MKLKDLVRSNYYIPISSKEDWNKFIDEWYKQGLPVTHRSTIKDWYLYWSDDKHRYLISFRNDGTLRRTSDTSDRIKIDMYEIDEFKPISNKTDISSDIIYKTGDIVEFNWNGANMWGKIFCVFSDSYTISKYDGSTTYLVMKKDIIGLKDDKMQILSAVNKWENGDFVVYCENMEECNKFFNYVGRIPKYIYEECCYQWVSDHVDTGAKWWFNVNDNKIITLQEFEQLQKDDKIGISSCVEFDVESWRNKEFVVKCDTQSELTKLMNAVDLPTNGLEFLFGWELHSPKYVFHSSDSDGWDWNSDRDGGAKGRKVIEFKDLAFIKDDKEKKLSDELMPNKIRAGRNLLKEYEINSGDWSIGVDFAKGYDIKWIGKGEEEMTKQTLLDRLTIKEVEINKKKKVVLLKDTYNGVASGKLVGNSFDFKSAFALACFNKFKPTLQNVDINESKGTVSLNAQYRDTATVKTTEGDKFNLLVGQALAWLESYLGLSKTKLKKLLSEIERDTLISQKETEIFNIANRLKKDIDKKAQSEKEKINKDTKKKLNKFIESLDKDLNDKK